MPKKTSLGMGSEPKLRHNAYTWGTFLSGFFEMYYKIPGNSAKLDQSNTSFVGILLGQTSVIRDGSRYDRAACRDIHTCRNKHAERWRARDT